MTQYCRYCNNMVCGDANYCTVKDKCYSDEHIKRPNNCKDFELNPMDALFENERGYRPRKTPEERAKIKLINFCMFE